MINVVQAKSKYKTCLRKARLVYDKLETDKLNKLRYQSPNARDYWKSLKSASQSPKANIPLSTFERYFKAINTPDSVFYLFINGVYIRGELGMMYEEINWPLSREEILNAIKQLKNNKGPDLDKMINDFFFIYGAHILLPYLDILFNTIFNHGFFPIDWSHGEFMPLHIKGSINNVELWGITLFC